MKRHATMVHQVKEYLRLRRSLGFELQSQGKCFWRLPSILIIRDIADHLQRRWRYDGRIFPRMLHELIVRKGFRLCVASLVI